MRTANLLLLTAAACGTALADFSYTTTTTSTGMMAGGDHTSKTYLKGQKMKVDDGTQATIFDFDAQTMTHVDNNTKTYRVSKFADMGDALKQTGTQISIDVKDTGEHKSINGFNASEVVFTTDATLASAKTAGMKMHLEMHIWVSRDVPGSQEMSAFFQRNADKFPWTSLAGGGRGDQSMAQAMTELRRKMAALKGVPVLQVMKVSMGGNEAQMAQMQQGMAQAQKQLEEMKRQGKLPPQLEQQLAKMQAMSSGGGGNQTTLESSGFSTGSIPDSVFAVPAGYQLSQR